LKIDRELVMNCDHDTRRQALINAIILLAAELDMMLIAEGVETRAEALWLARAGITRQQGFFYAKPAIGALGTELTPLLEALRKEAQLSSES
jgi:EAL domain-containing protein (putative c-di-GMP-specific phosphodiesterase class I)